MKPRGGSRAFRMSNAVGGGKSITSKEAFERYVAMPRRSITSLHQDLQAEGYSVAHITLRKWANVENWLERSEGVRVLDHIDAPPTRELIASRARQVAMNVANLSDVLQEMAVFASHMIAKASESLDKIECKTLAEVMTLTQAAAQLATAAEKIHSGMLGIVPAPDAPIKTSDAYDVIDVTPGPKATTAAPQLSDALNRFQKERATDVN